MPKGSATVQAFEVRIEDGVLKNRFKGLKPSSKVATNETGVAAAAVTVNEGGTALVAAHKYNDFCAVLKRLS